MKKLFKIGALALTVGIILFVVGMFRLDWDFLKLDAEQLTKMEHAFEGDVDTITAINANLDNGKVKIVRGGDTYKIVYYESDRTTSTIDTDSGTLNFRQKYKSKISFGFTGLKRHHYHTEIYLPEQKIINLSIITKNGNIEASGTFNNLTLESSNGKIEANKCIAQTILITSSNGAIELTNSQASSATLKSSNGKLEIEKVTVDKIYAKTSNGKIEVEKLESSDIELNTSNGSIKGTIKGSQDDYKITSSTSNGTSNLSQKTSGTKTLTAKTSNGSIHLTFSSH